MIVHTEEKPFTCDACEKSFIKVSYLKRHLRIHTREKAYKYETCGKDFTLSGHLKRHLLVRSAEKTYYLTFRLL